MAVLTHPLLHVVLVLLVVLASTSALQGLHPRGSEGGIGSHHDRRQVSGGDGADARRPSCHHGTCMSVDAPNPIAHIYPNNATGVLNATLAILPIPMETARRLIPAKWVILERPLRAALPGFPEGMYPVLLHAAHDHDVQLRAFNFTLPDFSRIGFEFPFIDLLGDGYSSFRWAPEQLLSADNEVALGGSVAYGTVAHPSKFDPPCEAFRPSTVAPDTFVFGGSSTASSDDASILLEFSPSPTLLYPVSFFKNITNQPSFANGSTCDNMIRLFNTTLTEGEGRAPRPVSGRVAASNVGPFASVEPWTGFRDVNGIHVATAFIENNYLDCRTMQGYQGTGGPGDSF